MESSRRRSLLPMAETLQNLVRGRLWLQVLIGMVLGIATGMALGPSAGLVTPSTASAIGNWLGFPGQLFLATIQMIVIPLVFASIIRGLSSNSDLGQLRRLGLRTVLYFVLTTAIAVAIGIWLALLIGPGHYLDAASIRSGLDPLPEATAGSLLATPSISNLPQQFLTLVPSNPLSSMVESNMLQVVIFASVVGVALVMMERDKAKPMLDLLASLQEVCMTVVRWAMWLAPWAVFGLLAQLTSKIGLQSLIGMAIYVGTVLLGLLCLLVLLLAIARFGAGMPPGRFLRAARDVMLLAFSTSSSAAVMPLSIKTAEERLGVRPVISQFVIPMGATINMNGTALYQGVAAIFLAQVFGVEIGAGGLTLIVLTAVGASIGSPATPGVGIIVLSSILATVGVPPAGIALIMGVDRILDMSRTSLNVVGDLVACVLMDRWMQREKDAPSPVKTDGTA
ncbi:MAG: dicarboxylate/amino acid:cation symporter [Rhodospirillaceae bacterium]|nr:dicarboxylate/amino acid:cation symporter [Rhodospirillaceae bacterium]